MRRNDETIRQRKNLQKQKKHSSNESVKVVNTVEDMRQNQLTDQNVAHKGSK